MAKRLSAERPYTPLDASLINDVLSQIEPVEVPSMVPKRRRAVTPDAVPAKSLQDQVERGPSKLPRVAPRDRVAAAAPPRPAQERMVTAARVKMSKREKREFEAFVARLADTLDATIVPSNVLRALASVVQNAEPSVAEQAQRHLPIRRPSNNDVVAYAEFEHRLVQILDAAIRRAPPVR